MVPLPLLHGWAKKPLSMAKMTLALRIIAPPVHEASLSPEPLNNHGGLLNIPLYLIGEFPRLMKLAMERVGG